MSLTSKLKERAIQLGFQLAGCAPAVTPTGIHRLYEWMENGFAGEMHYFASRREAYKHPRFVLDGAKSLLVLGMNYMNQTRQDCTPGSGKISNYAWGEIDYHDLIHQQLKALIAGLQTEQPHVNARGVVDTAPLLEREFAQLAGLGWNAKNTMVINRSLGSYFFIAVVLLDIELEYDEPFTADHCGTCTACLDACPTDAFPTPYVLDATKCISYLTIEHRSAIHETLRPKMDDWIFGCDVCQAVCPWNNKTVPSLETKFYPQANANPCDLIALFQMDESEFRTRFRKTPLWRARRRQILRNAAIVIGNQKYREAADVLADALRESDPVIVDACCWALEQLS